VSGVEKVNDMLVVVTPTSKAKFRTVVSGDNLSKIAKAHYGDGNEYTAISRPTSRC